MIPDNGYAGIIKPGYYLRYDQRSVHKIIEAKQTRYKGFPLYDFVKDLDGLPRVGEWDIGPYEYLGV